MDAFVCYKLPYASSYVRIDGCGEPDVLADYSEIGGRGFVVAPFDVSAGCPIVVFRGESVERVVVERSRADGVRLASRRAEEEERRVYAADYGRFHTELCEGRMEKLVLSRSSVVECVEDVDALKLFERACTLYDGQFVALFSSAQTGTWLMATPEVLLEGGGCEWQTMALAGTRSKTAGVWSEKNRREQRLVTDYLTERISRLTKDFQVAPTRSVEAGRLLHLRTDIRFRLSSPERVGRLVSLLHPTPAVCGLPAAEARRFILANESHARSYYSGFCGLLDERETRLWVSLRCMNIAGRRCRLYAGGGLLAESDEQSEWEETEAKLETMLRVFFPRFATKASLRAER